MDSKKVLIVLPHMAGGGAERVAAQIMNKLNERGYDTRFILTSAKKNEVVRSDLNEKTQLILLTEEMKGETAGQKLSHFPARAYSTIFGKLYEKRNKYVPTSIGKATIDWQYHREIAWLKSYLQQSPDMTVIVFLQPSIPMVLLAAKGLPNKIIISERADPNRLMKKRYGKPFIEKYYTRADVAVFQTDDARNVYPRNVAEKGVVISNPIKANLPEPYHGERNKYITTFCRISPEKDLLTLIKAFYLVHQKHPDYQLKIIGDAINENEIQYKQELFEYIQKHDLINYIVFKPFTKRVHKEIIHDAMYVNSSVTEGLSNAMLESMAIGLPVICTDCPIGGARATIIHEVNGLLTEVGNAEKLADKMLLLIDNNVLSNQISNDSVKVRKEKSLQSITDQWVGVL